MTSGSPGKYLMTISRIEFLETNRLALFGIESCCECSLDLFLSGANSEFGGDYGRGGTVCITPQPEWGRDAKSVRMQVS